VLESFESLGMPSRNCFDLLVNTIVELAWIASPTDIVVLEFSG
jgi:hypothetical protein